MNNKNYIVINGRKAELTKEQLRALGIEALGIEALKPDIFNRTKEGKFYHYIDSTGQVSSFSEDFSGFDTNCYNVANYCTNLEVMEQRALHETLNRLLWRFSMEHDGDKIDWQHINLFKAYIYYDYKTKMWSIAETLRLRDVGQIYFYSDDIAKLAIEEIVKPFMAEHPDFKW